MEWKLIATICLCCSTTWAELGDSPETVAKGLEAQGYRLTGKSLPLFTMIEAGTPSTYIKVLFKEGKAIAYSMFDALNPVTDERVDRIQKSIDKGFTLFYDPTSTDQKSKVYVSGDDGTCIIQLDYTLIVGTREGVETLTGVSLPHQKGLTL